MSEEVKVSRALVGQVVSNKMDKTIVVVVMRKVRHALYGKYIKRRTKLHAHDPNNECQEGDTVMVMPCRPLSKTKTYKLVKVVERAAEAAEG